MESSHINTCVKGKERRKSWRSGKGLCLELTSSDTGGIPGSNPGSAFIGGRTSVSPEPVTVSFSSSVK